ncbi:hypothetical protein ATK30_7890 [Amycolatopsis echigonensis]|uniref:site-specific DNA-methyltransferase (adenine-specific) n=1 Tax=Amycolatopsis echigonensis TaxID=2576905 RepID=A0A2N3WSV4_9PSEU|nr:DNA methyltransferase [Amycolatopsis niigatensis]PKV96925.1 hypothetical protein ATK30_7890 [Amycolatopsis niigatensis]
MSSAARSQVFPNVHTVGGLLPADMLVRISEGKDVSGSLPGDYHVVGARSVRDDAERHWDYLKSLWAELRKELPSAPAADTPADPMGLAITQWLLPLFGEFGFGQLTKLDSTGLVSDDSTKSFAISHRWNHVPIHLTEWNVSLDRRPSGPGSVPAQSLVQELLNRTDAHLWGVVTNGRQLRLLRDSSAFATAAYIEFDLDAIFDGELFSDFVLLYRLLHVTRFAIAAEAAPSTCWLEKWRLEAIASGTRALDSLRIGVQNAIMALGTGFLKHPANTALRESVDVTQLHAALLRLVYRMLFVFVAEDRDKLHQPDVDQQTRERYAQYFSTARLRDHARRRRGTAHDDLYQALRIVLDALGDENGRPELGLPGLGGIFDDNDADAPLRGLSLSNEYLLTAVRHLAQTRDIGARRWRSVDYRNLDAEELGSIYESLLELVPRHSAVDREFALLDNVAGNARKTTGSYYTPSSLIACLLDSTLDPVLDDAVKRAEQAASAAGNSDPSEFIVGELLALRVCDPACGSGHFLVAAARRIAKRVAAVREHNPEPTLDAVQHALREVISRCIYGVDINPMAVELAKVSLWLEALEPGKPLGFLDAHVKCGNALIGATPALMRGGIPDEAFKPIEGDDKKIARAVSSQNKSERLNQLGLFDLDTEVKVSNANFAVDLSRITSAPSDLLADVHQQAAAFQELEASAAYTHARHIADAWCAAFLWPKAADAPRAVTEDVFRALQDPEADAAPQSTHDEVARLAKQYRFFHWHLEYPEVFDVGGSGTAIEAAGWSGGFDCVLGNPPWERVKLQEQEFFAQRDQKIATAKNAAARKDLIAQLKSNTERHELYKEFEEAKRQAEGESHILRNSGRYPLTGRGDINTYAVFAETDRTLTGPRGRMGVIVPTGIATDATTQYFFKDLVNRGSLAALYDFENRSGLFPAVDSRMKFCTLSLAGSEVREEAASFAFFLHDPTELDDAGKAFALTPDEITLLNPNTGTCPVFRSRRDAEITLGIYRRVPVLIKEPDERGQGGSNPWGVSFMRMFDMSNDAHLFRGRDELEPEGWQLHGNVFTRDSERMLPLYQGMMADLFDHRAASVVRSATAQKRLNQPSPATTSEHEDPAFAALPAAWVGEKYTPAASNGWWFAFSSITAPTNARSFTPYALPRVALGNSAPILQFNKTTAHQGILLVNLSSFVLDYIARLKIGGTNFNYFYVKQFPTVSPKQASPHALFVTPRLIELSYTTYDMETFARDQGDPGTPFQWKELRRSIIRAELDALFFHLYGINRGDVDYILNTFPIVKRKDEAKYGTYRTKDLILTEYDRMAEAGVSIDNPLVDGENYTSTLNPPPGHGPRHPPRNKDSEEA